MPRVTLFRLLILVPEFLTLPVMPDPHHPSGGFLAVVIQATI